MRATNGYKTMVFCTHGGEHRSGLTSPAPIIASLVLISSYHLAVKLWSTLRYEHCQPFTMQPYLSLALLSALAATALAQPDNVPSAIATILSQAGVTITGISPSQVRPLSLTSASFLLTDSPLSRPQRYKPTSKNSAYPSSRTSTPKNQP